MDYREDKRVDEAISTVEWMRDRINELESDNEKLEEREKELMDKVDELEAELKQHQQ